MQIRGSHWQSPSGQSTVSWQETGQALPWELGKDQTVQGWQTQAGGNVERQKQISSSCSTHGHHRTPWDICISLSLSRHRRVWEWLSPAVLCPVGQERSLGDQADPHLQSAQGTRAWVILFLYNRLHNHFCQLFDIFGLETELIPYPVQPRACSWQTGINETKSFSTGLVVRTVLLFCPTFEDKLAPNNNMVC